jgi:hypothetical protein
MKNSYLVKNFHPSSPEKQPDKDTNYEEYLDNRIKRI